MRFVEIPIVVEVSFPYLSLLIQQGNAENLSSYHIWRSYIDFFHEMFQVKEWIGFHQFKR